MRNIFYKKIEDGYLDLFEIDKMQSQWGKIRKELISAIKDGGAESIYPVNVKWILLASPETLVGIFANYYNKKREGLIQKSLEEALRALFCYSSDRAGHKGYQPKIAGFIMKHADEIGVHTCFYCEMSYINVYGVNKVKKNHFDLDHFLPKAECPIVGLSLYNFIPSCSVCNEKLKRNSILGLSNKKRITKEDQAAILKLFPSNKDYSFETDVDICINGVEKKDITKTLRLQDNPDRYRIVFEYNRNEIYQEEVSKLRLEERYNYHKIEALRLYDLLNDYPDELRKKISELFKGGKTPDEIKEDLFGITFAIDNHRCFEKLKRDISKKFF